MGRLTSNVRPVNEISGLMYTCQNTNREFLEHTMKMDILLASTQIAYLTLLKRGEPTIMICIKDKIPVMGYV